MVRRNKVINKHKLGFTLIELLVVIMVIGILSAGFILLINPNEQISKGRDAQRKSDLAKLQAALESYRAQQNAYPNGQAGINPFSSCGIAFSSSGTPSVTYINQIPCDPSNGTPYNYFSNGTIYCVMACMENASSANSSSVTCNDIADYRAPNGCNNQYILNNP